MPNIVSVYSGCGGLDLGFHQAGYETILATDNWKIACETLEANMIADEVKCADIREIDFKSILIKRGLKNVDCLIGGPPCPPYSQTRHYLIDKKKGVEDEKYGFTLKEYFRAVEELNPTIFFFENVDGFLHKLHLYEFEYLRDQAESLGYNITYKVVNAANYGVAQTRKRFICVGVKKELPAFVFPTETHADPAVIKKLSLLTKPWVTCGDILNEIDYDLPEDANQSAGSKDKHLLPLIPPGENYLFFTEKRGYPNPLFKWKSRYWTFLLKLSQNRPSWTIQASFSNNQGPFHWKNRFLRIAEIKRIQSFDDKYNLKGSFQEQWRQVGNAVPPYLAFVFASKIKMTYFTKNNSNKNIKSKSELLLL
jgi:DNA (cytosine-5)-methyltransferase 1